MFPALDEVAERAGEGDPMARLCLLALMAAAGATDPALGKMPEGDAKRAAARLALRGAHMGACAMGGAFTAIGAWGEVLETDRADADGGAASRQAWQRRHQADPV